jgi:capsular polysaccharide transport system ATP-binding protein
LFASWLAIAEKIDDSLRIRLRLAIECDRCLVDEVAAGNQRSRRRSKEALIARRDNATLIMISHDRNTLRAYCRRGTVLYGGARVTMT